jgi:hypothetical protein
MHHRRCGLHHGQRQDFPGIVTAVVGRCEATLDQRDLDAEVLAAMYREAQRRARSLPRKKVARSSGRASGISRQSPFIPN